MQEALIRLEDVAEDLARDRASPRAALSLQRRRAPLAAPAEQLKLLDSMPLTAEFHALAPTLAPASRTDRSPIVLPGPTATSGPMLAPAPIRASGATTALA